MSKYISADFVLPIAGYPIPNGIIGVDDSGTITGVWRSSATGTIIPSDQIKRYSGVIVPGFVNAHCHLELSHMHGQIPENLGLVRFIDRIIRNRHTDNSVIQDAMQKADQEMFNNGIVAVGDHVNTSISANIKRKSKIHYHSFVEVLGFEPEKADEIWLAGEKVMKEFGDLPKSITPHAPYSVSKPLFRLIRSNTDGVDNLISMHNQEAQAENEFFRFKTGDFVDFYTKIGKDLSHFAPRGITSLRTIAPLLPNRQRIQLVHNTFTNRKDAHMLGRLGRDIFWCICPKANLYIENTLPEIDQIQEGSDFPLTLGTDSLALNGSLCILSELKTLHNKRPNLSFEETIVWATLNGAKFLGIDDQFGSIEVGKRPGLNLLNNMKGLKLMPDTTVSKLF